MSDGVRCLLFSFVHTNRGDVKDFEEAEAYVTLTTLTLLKGISYHMHFCYYLWCLLFSFVHTNRGDVKDFEEKCNFLRKNYIWILWANFTFPDTTLLKCPDLWNSITLDWLNNLSSFEMICMGIWKFSCLKVS